MATGMRFQELRRTLALMISSLNISPRCKVCLIAGLIWNLQSIQQTVSAMKKGIAQGLFDRLGEFYDIKISRVDFATPALCRASDKRVDRFSIIDQIAAAVDTDPSIYSQFHDFINGINAKNCAYSSGFLLTTPCRFLL